MGVRLGESDPASKCEEVATATTAHAPEVAEVHERLLGQLPVQARYVDVGPGRRVHAIEAGEGPPLVLLHGTNGSALLLLPLIERLQGVRAIAVDRPGFGLSDPVEMPRERFRDAAVEWIDGLFNALEVDSAALLGSSMGGTWSLWYAMAHPAHVHQLVLLGAAPLLPDTRPPAPLRVMATPLLGELLRRLMKPTPKRVVRMARFVGEGETIADHPEQIEAMVAAASDPLAAAAKPQGASVGSYPRQFPGSPARSARGTRSASRADAARVGERDPVGKTDVARATANTIPDAKLELLPAGHVLWLGHPDRVAELVVSFVP